MSHERASVVGVPGTGGRRARPRSKRGGGASDPRQPLLPEGARPVLAAGFDACGVAPGSRRFVDAEPTEPFVWIFFNRDGTVSEYPTGMESYLTFRRMYGVPEGRWRASDDRGDER